jgi:hypothetical protein
MTEPRGSTYWVVGRYSLFGGKREWRRTRWHLWALLTLWGLKISGAETWIEKREVPESGRSE